MALGALLAGCGDKPKPPAGGGASERGIGGSGKELQSPESKRRMPAIVLIRLAGGYSVEATAPDDAKELAVRIEPAGGASEERPRAFTLPLEFTGRVIARATYGDGAPVERVALIP